MKTLKMMLTFCAFVLLMTVIVHVFNNDKSKVIPVPSKEAGIGHGENPRARLEFDFLRLRDPSTNRIPDNIRKKEAAFSKALPVKEKIAAFDLKDPRGLSKVQVYNWSRRGPINVGGRTRALAVDVSNESILLAGGTSGGLWRSTNSGTTWIKTTNISDLHSVTCIAQDTRSGKTGTWYYGTGEYRGQSASDRGSVAYYSGDGIFKSTDGGNTWTLLSSTSTSTPHVFDSDFDYIYNLAIDVSNLADDEIYAATYGGIHKSTDGGTSWTQPLGEIYDGTEPVYSDVAVTSTGVVYAALSSGKDEGVWRSVDGETWTNLTPSEWPDVYDRFVIGIAPSNENVVYFLGEAAGGNSINGGNLFKYTYVTGDGTSKENTWEDLSLNLPDFDGVTGTFSSQNSYNLLIKVYPDSENVVFLGDINLFRSENGFASDDQITKIGGYSAENTYSSYPNHHPDLHSLVFLPSDPNSAISGSDGGVHKTSDITADDVVWTSYNNGFYTTQFYTVSIDQSSTTDFVIGGMQDNGTFWSTSENLSSDWKELLSGDGAYCAIPEGTAGDYRFFVSSQNGDIYYMIYDQNYNFTAWSYVTPAEAGVFLFIAPFVMDPNNNNSIFLAEKEGIWRNSNVFEITENYDAATTINWTPFTNTFVTYQVISTLAVSTTPADRLYYGTSEGKLYSIANTISASDVPVDIWSDKGLPAGAYVSSIAVHPGDADKLMVTFSNYGVKSVFYSSDAGDTWTDVSGNLEENADGSGNGPSVRSAAILPTASGDVYFAGTSTGLYSTASLNGTSTVWVREGEAEIGNVVVEMVKTRPDGLVAAATHGTGIFTTTIETSVDDDITGSPDNFRLKQNYPNPFNMETVIEFDLPKPGNVNIIIYNELGQHVRTLVYNKQYSAGTHKAVFNGRDDSGNLLSSGLYFYRIKTGNNVKTHKMVLLK
ncbi:T9SS type A sorting domain-containing protein [candidate division KSB1 bacterium]